MKERIANYTPNVKRTWFERKMQGGINRVSPYIREWKWSWHKLWHPVRYNLAKVPTEGVPLIINNYNRLDILKQQMDWLLMLEGVSGILIVDNDSNYPPLLEYYQSLADHDRVQVVYLGHNSWRKGAATLAKILLRKHPHIILTDPDLLPYPNTPIDLVSKLVQLMATFPEYNHIGLSLEINDLPEHNPMRERIFQHESKHWRDRIPHPTEQVFLAPIDTTFAMYHNKSVIEQLEPSLRTDRPYTLKHVDWYQDPSIQTDEYLHYMQSAKIFATWATELKSMLRR
jgi:hypothetical protein